MPPGLEAQWEGFKRFPLGKSLPAAYKLFAERIGTPRNVRTVGELLDRYGIEVVPTKAPKTQYDNAGQIKRLRLVFEAMPLGGVEPHHIYKYAAMRDAKVGAKREIEVLSHAFTKAVEWGLLKRHPFKGEVRLEGEPPRTRYVEDWEIVECLQMKPRRKKGSVRMLQAYIRLKLLTGMSRGDMLRLEPARHFKEDGIHNQRHKTIKTTGQRTIYEWTPERRAAVEDALAARPVDLAPTLFCTATGEGYMNEATGTAGAFNSLWQNFMTRVLKDTKVTERFTEHDIRAKCASDAESLEKARMLLAHADGRTTARVYRRKPDRV